ncbi:MAG: GH92 family glycosyl hydrolase [Bacteroidota bacterium]
MRLTYLILLCTLTACILLSSCSRQSEKIPTEDPDLISNPADLVNPFIDTHDSRWFFFSSATRPFGMVNLSPDTDTESTWHSGYLYDSDSIRCFSHVHGWQLAGVAVLPLSGEMIGHLGMDNYQSFFSHEDEVVKPGYHKVFLRNYDVEAELTSTKRVGFHRYRFQNNKARHVVFDVGAFLAHSPAIDTYIKRISDKSLEGFILYDGARFREKPYKIYFYTEFDEKFIEFGTWKDKKLRDLSFDSVVGEGTGAYVSFPENMDEIKFKVAISYTSIENARINLEEELNHWDFDRVVQDSYDEWNDWLGRIRVSGGTRQQQVKFYSDLWHALQGRRIVSDVNGYYIDNTGSESVIRRVALNEEGKPRFPHYNFDSLWGSHWTINILWSMVYPELMDGFCNTMIDMYENGGFIPRGPSAGQYTWIMVGDPATSFFATAYNKGIDNYDIEKAYEGLYKNAFEEGIRDSGVYGIGHSGSMKYYLERGYVPEDVPPGRDRGATLTLEYAYQDWCLAQISKRLDKTNDYELFMKRAENYKNIWNPESGLMHPREKDGSWIKDFKPIDDHRHTKGFVEANASIYTHFVPHDIAGLAELFGGYDKYNSFLNECFEKSKPHGFVAKTKKMHATNWVNYGNEPGHGMAHCFNHSGAPWLSQKWVREVKEALNDTTPYGGYNGDEDQGKAGSLGVLMAIGLFQEDGGAAEKPFYEITSPIFDKVVIELNNDYYPGTHFVIETKNNSRENLYIQSAKLNGKKLDNCWFYHDIFAKGGKLELELGDAPNKNWGVKQLPPSMSR